MNGEIDVVAGGATVGRWIVRIKASSQATRHTFLHNFRNLALDTLADIVKT